MLKTLGFYRENGKDYRYLRVSLEKCEDLDNCDL